MAFIPTPLVARVAIAGTVFATPFVNTLWFRKGSNYDLTALIDLVDGVTDWVVTDLLTKLSSSYICNSVTAYDMSSANGPMYSEPINTAGSVAAPVGSGQVTCDVLFRTSDRGRSARGANKVGPVGENQIDNQIILASFRTGLLTAYANLNTAVQAQSVGSEHVVVSQYIGSTPRVTGIVREVLTYAIASQYGRTLKSRREPGDQ